MAGTIASGQDFKSISFRSSYTEQSLLHIFLLIMYVVVIFLSQVIFLFLLSLGVVMYANEVEIIGRQKLPEIKN